MPSPVIELNRAAAIAKRDGPLAGLTLVEGILYRGELLDYHLAHSARAAYERALELTQQVPERRFIEARIKALE